MTTLRPALALAFLLIATSSFAQSPVPSTQPDARELAGLWEAKLRLGPETGGTLLIERTAAGWRAEIAGHRTDIRLVGDTLSFELSDEQAGFRGRFSAGRNTIIGHWLQRGASRYASPVTLTRIGKVERWRGEVDPLSDEMTMYLVVEPRSDGTMRAFIRNPERNSGFFMRLATLERDGRTVRLRSAPRGGRPAEVVAEGMFADDVLSLPLVGGTYGFRRVSGGAPSDFHARSRPGAGYRYAPPPQLDDGWPVATPEEVGLSRDSLERLVRAIIDAPVDSVSVRDVHGVLIARHGKLVLEEYFHGWNRDKPHDTRSGSKSMGSVLLGAAIQAGVPLRPESRVYQVMNGGTLPGGLDPRKQKLTLEHLLTMSSGLDADDSDENSTGSENFVQQGNDPDWWKHTLDLGMAREPGEKAVYISMGANLVGAVIHQASRRSLTDLFHERIAEPLQIRSYWLNLQPNGEPYLGGGMRFLPRDFMKLGQLMLNGGTWNGRRIVSAEWAKKSVAPLYPLGRNQYGYLWWIREYPYQGRTIQAFYAAGNGGQLVMGIPELDLVFASYGGNYGDNPVIFSFARELVPQYVLPTVVTSP